MGKVTKTPRKDGAFNPSDKRETREAMASLEPIIFRNSNLKTSCALSQDDPLWRKLIPAIRSCLQYEPCRGSATDPCADPFEAIVRQRPEALVTTPRLRRRSW